MNILVVDDESLARRRLVSLVEELGEPYVVVAQASNGLSAVKVATEKAIDVVLMDVQMPGMDGLEAARVLAELSVPPAVIFTTAYEEHALPAFESHAVDYLLKPIRTEKLSQALQKVSILTRPQQTASEVQSNEFIAAQIRGKIQRIPLSEIYYLHADNKYVVVRHLQGEALIEESLVSLEQRFPEDFFRVHRNALVAGKKIRGMGKSGEGQVVVSFGDIEDELPVSRRHLPAVRRWFKG